jgi:pilus assembly protein CpaB
MSTRTATRMGQRARAARKISPTVLICAAILGAALLLRKGSEPPPVTIAPAPVVAAFDTVTLPVPAAYVPAGTKIKEVHFKKVAFPKHQVPDGALTNLEPILEAVALTPLPANLPLFNENISLAAQGSNPVLDRIPPGMRAMTIRVDATSAVEGWAGSGSIVDVLLVEKEKTSVIAEKVKVLSAERSVSPVEGASSPNIPSTVTILVSQEQCMAINTAVPLGRIAFALRSLRDEDSWKNPLYTAERLKGGPESAPRAQVKGYIKVSGETQQAYALADDKWVPTEVVPPGFFSAGKK